MKQWHLGYLAAMIDAESHVGIQRDTGPRRRTPAYVIRYELTMVDKKTIDFVNSLLPRAKRLYTRSHGRRSAYYRLRLCQQEALNLLRLALPYVQGKQRQVEICLELDALRRSYSPSRKHHGAPHFLPLPVEFGIKADVLFAEFRSLQLNKKPRKK